MIAVLAFAFVIMVLIVGAPFILAARITERLGERER